MFTPSSIHCLEVAVNTVALVRRCFGLRTAVVTSIVDNAVGRLLEDLILQGGVDMRHVQWVPFDGLGRAARNGLNFTEAGYGVRGALGCGDRGHTAVSQLKKGDINWEKIFGEEACAGSIAVVFLRLSATTPKLLSKHCKPRRNTAPLLHTT